MKTRESDIKITKNIIRNYIRQQLLSLSNSSKETFSNTITEYFLTTGRLHTLDSLFVYISRPSEVNTCQLIELALQTEVKVYVPKIVNNHMIAQRLLRVTDLVPGKWGLLEPVASSDSPTHVDLVITPGLAFTKKGARLGHGAGFYDKWLSNNSYTSTMALAFDITLLESLPLSPYDIKIDNIITEVRYIDCREERGDI